MVSCVFFFFLFFFFCFFFFFLCFFFQAEDGIRDTSVTGVQTCALPILDKLVEESKPEPSVSEHMQAELEPIDSPDPIVAEPVTVPDTTINEAEDRKSVV